MSPFRSGNVAWRPAVGVLVLGAIAVGLSIQGAAAEKARTSPRDKARAMPVLAESPRGGVNVPRNVTWQPVGPEDLEDFTGQSATIGAAPGLTEGEAVGAVANTGIGACCVTPCACVGGQTSAQCTALGGVWTEKETCENDFCGCLVRACCNPAGTCIGDSLRSACESAGNTWHIEASCVGASSLPLPICNRYDINNCNWDNGFPLNDGGASRQHIHGGGVGQLPRYDFESADDFILRGPDNDRCLIDRIHAWWRHRPSGTGGSATPNGLLDLVGINVTIYCSFLSPYTDIDSPGGHGVVPIDADDIGNKFADTLGGVQYARHFPIDEGGIDEILEDLDNNPGNGFQPFCDPNPIDGFETEHVYRAEVGLVGNEISPPIQVNKNKKYWIVVQGLFPFNDGLRETLQTWQMGSQNNTGLRSMTHRTGNPEYVWGRCSLANTPCRNNAACPTGETCDKTTDFDGDGAGGQDIWVPRNRTLGSAVSQTGNAANARRCSVSGECCTGTGQGTCPAGNTCVYPAGAPPANTRLDFAYRLFGTKDPDPKPNDDCVATVLGDQNAFDGWTHFDLDGATTDGPNPRTCGIMTQDLWFTYTSRLNGLVTVSVDATCDISVAIYEDPVCSGDCTMDLDCDTFGVYDVHCTGDMCEIACGNPVSVPALANQSLLIRVGTKDGTKCKGKMHIRNEPICGHPAGGDCCTDQTRTCSVSGGNCKDNSDCPAGTCDITTTMSCHAGMDCPEGETCLGTCSTTPTTKCTGDSDCPPAETCNLPETCVVGAPPHPVGCTSAGTASASCCEIVCQIPGEEVCCFSQLSGWDSECNLVAKALGSACYCPCDPPLECPMGAVLEAEACGTSSNGGCNNLPAAETFQELGKLEKSPTDVAVCGQVFANANTRDTDWYRFQVNDPDGDGFAQVSISLTGDGPTTVFVIASETDADPKMSFCRDAGRTCSGNDTPCTMDSNCPPGQTCPALPDASTLLLFEDIGSGGCLKNTVTSCLPAPGTYVMFVSMAEEDADGELGSVFNGFPCGSQNAYTATISVDNVCADGACCACQGNCVDTDTVCVTGDDCIPGVPCVDGTCNDINESECRSAAGNFAGEGTTCVALPPEINCPELAHGCVNATPIACQGEVTLVDLTGADPTTEFEPEEPYVCGATGHDPNDRKWYSFVATSTSVRVHTCDSTNPARDSLLAVFGSECPKSGTCPSGAACTPGESFCGAECCNPLVPLSTVGCGDDECGFTEFLSSICISPSTDETELVIGETYLIQISNWDFQTNGAFSMVCEQPCTGSCCNMFTALCTDDTPVQDCVEPGEFTEFETCAELDQPCGVGACCAPNGTCTETLPGDCPKGSNHMPGTTCSTVICNRYDERQYQCDFKTGTIGTYFGSGDEAPFGFVGQFFSDPGSNLWLGRADNFTLKGDSLNPCRITQLRFKTFHVSHDATHGCPIGGGPACSDTAADYEGIIVTISKDEEGDYEKGPTCVPNCPPTGCEPGPDGDYHEGTGCLTSIVFGPAAGDPPPMEGTFWTFLRFNTPVRHLKNSTFLITMNFDPPVVLEKNQKYWLEITPIFHEVAGYSIVWFASIRFDGNFTQSFSSGGSQMWTPSMFTPNDMLFEMSGDNPKPGCGGCMVAGDHVFPFCQTPPGQPDVDDLGCCVAGFADVDDCPQCDMVPFIGECTPTPCTTSQDCSDVYGIAGIPCSGGRCFHINGDDLLVEIDAFAGCPGGLCCPASCPAGACIGDYDGDGDTECMDGIGIDPNSGVLTGLGMSQSDCINRPVDEGCYCGDNTTCTAGANSCPGTCPQP